MPRRRCGRAATRRRMWSSGRAATLDVEQRSGAGATEQRGDSGAPTHGVPLNLKKIEDDDDVEVEEAAAEVVMTEEGSVQVARKWRRTTPRRWPRI